MNETVRRRSNTRARLIEAAESLLAEAGMLSFSIDAVCKQAGFTRGAFYSNFGSINDLLFALYEHKTRILFDELSAMPPFEPGIDLEKAVERLLDAVPSDANWYALRAVFALQSQGSNDIEQALHEHSRDLQDRLMPFVGSLLDAAGLAPAISLAETTQIVIAAHVGAVLQGALVENKDELRRNSMLSALHGAADLEPADRTLYALSAVPGGILKVDTASGDTATLVESLSVVPDGVVLDRENNELVFTHMGEPDEEPVNGSEPPFYQRNGGIRALSLETGAIRTVVEDGAFTTGKQLARDAATGRLYWSDREDHGVYRCEADGSNITALVRTSGSTPSEIEDQCVGVAVDAVNGYLYWTQKGEAKGGQGRILRAGLELPEGADPAQRTDIELLWENLPEPIDLEMELDSNLLYWTDRGAEPDGNTLNRAQIPAAGDRGSVVEVVARGFKEAIGLALDHGRGVAFVSDLGGHVYEVSLASGQVRVVLSGSAMLTGVVLG